MRRLKIQRKHRTKTTDLCDQILTYCIKEENYTGAYDYAVKRGISHQEVVDAISVIKSYNFNFIWVRDGKGDNSLEFYMPLTAETKVRQLLDRGGFNQLEKDRQQKIWGTRNLREKKRRSMIWYLTVLVIASAAFYLYKIKK